ncbi:DoxX family protein [Heyndrickxia sporothermodurans]|uniref:DoxX family protein n=1 Tax=Heyndrickxia sporothermodurans TaxID=46224 RepID=UPI002E21D6CE|nr:DoxX family protein [Heyndrickxia sporothermodurans]
MTWFVLLFIYSIKGGITIHTKIIRYLVGYVFITSGVMKIVSEDLGNYFTSLGLPYPILLMNAVAIIELICGILILANKWVKQAAIPLMAIMIAAILLTKVPILRTGLIAFMFNARLDIIMIGLLAILYKQDMKNVPFK